MSNMLRLRSASRIAPARFDDGDTHRPSRLPSLVHSTRQSSGLGFGMKGFIGQRQVQEVVKIDVYDKVVLVDVGALS
jgi:hypothetical protein